MTAAGGTDRLNDLTTALPLRILFVAWRDLGHPAAGGSEVVIDALARGAMERGHEVALLCGGPVTERSYRTVDSGGVYTQYLRAPLEYLREFRHWDLVVDVGNGIPFFSPLYRQKPVICLVHHVHAHQWVLHFGPAVGGVGKYLETEVVPRLYRNCPFITVSPSTAEALEGIGVPSDRIHLVHNGVDLPDPLPDHQESDEPTFLVLGRLAPIKRLGLALDLWAAVRERLGRGRLIIAGDGPEYEELAARDVAGVELLGWVSDERKTELLTNAWCLIHTAEQEGWGLVITEAAAYGTPTLAFDVPGVRDAVVDGVTGHLARSNEEFVAAWVELATDDARRAELGVQAQERALSFTWDQTTEEFLKVAQLATDEWRSPMTVVGDRVRRSVRGIRPSDRRR